MVMVMVSNKLTVDVVHVFDRRFYKFKGGGRCDQNSTSPPCVG